MRAPNAVANLLELLFDLIRPLRMLLRLPGQIEDTVPVLDNAAVLDFHADRDKRAAGRIERVQPFPPYPRIQRFQTGKHRGGTETREDRLRFRLVVVQG